MAYQDIVRRDVRVDIKERFDRVCWIEEPTMCTDDGGRETAIYKCAYDVHKVEARPDGVPDGYSYGDGYYTDPNKPTGYLPLNTEGDFFNANCGRLNIEGDCDILNDFDFALQPDDNEFFLGQIYKAKNILADALHFTSGNHFRIMGVVKNDVSGTGQKCPDTRRPQTSNRSVLGST